MTAIELLHPASTSDVVEMLRASSSTGRRVLVTGGRQHLDKGNPVAVDAELWTTQLDGVEHYEPAEMVAVVGAGMRVRDLDAVLAEGGQEWPHDAAGETTVGGVIASAATSPRRLRMGAIRDSVLEVHLVTGDGRLVRGGGRTVKNVTGYDLPRALTGSLGTLGVLVQVAIKVRPLPRARRTLHIKTDDPIAVGGAVLHAVPLPVAVLATPGAVQVRLEGWPDEVTEQTEAARAIAGIHAAVEDDEPFPIERPWTDAPIVAEVAVAPSRVSDILPFCGDVWGTPLGTGLVWAAAADDVALATLRERVGPTGVAPVIAGPGGLGGCDLGTTEAVHRRLKHAFDPGGVLAPGRGWGGI
ncbi:MAG: FAD-binding protein [Actinomycetota bacterium]